MNETNRNYHNPNPLALPLDELPKDLQIESKVPAAWRAWEINLPEAGVLRTVRAAFWHIPSQKLWVDPNICGGEGSAELALSEHVAITMFEDNPRHLPIILAPASWTRAKFPDNSRWVKMLEAKFREGRLVRRT
jgi:hypothetical protein